MKNKFLVGTLTVFCGILFCILILNLSNSKAKKQYDFERNFSDNKILLLVNEYKKLNENSVNDLYFSNKIIVEGKTEITLNNLQKINIHSSDCFFRNKISRKIEVPFKAIVFFIDDLFLIYEFENKIFRLNLMTNEKIVIDSIKIKFSNLITLDNFPNKYLFLGEILENNVYKTGFFVIDFFNKTVIDVNLINKNNKSFKPEITTMNSGYFQKIGANIISYACDKNSKIFLFDEFGVFFNMLKTKENIPPPKVIKNNRGDCFYSRDGLRYTNSGVFMDSSCFFVFSNFSKYEDTIIIDQYSKKTLQYIKSFKLDYKNYCSRDIANVYVDKGFLILKFENSYASFKFSRYY